MRRIDERTRGDHSSLVASDECFFLSEYTTGQGPAFSSTNQFIFNFKKSVDRRGTPEWQYKENAIHKGAQLVRSVLQSRISGTLVPIPPSKSKLDPLYDDRMTRLLRKAVVGLECDTRELVEQVTSTKAVHLSAIRFTVREIYLNYRINERVATPVPLRIIVVDDILTTGAHFKAMQQRLLERYPKASVAGLFLARRSAKS